MSGTGSMCELLLTRISSLNDRMLLAAMLLSYDMSDNYEKSFRLHGSDLSLPESSLNDTGNN
jgi:hypothetical protein